MLVISGFYHRMHSMNHEQHANAQEDCVFCKIVKGELPAHKLYEDEFTFAFLNNSPTSPGHALVIPKDHFENIYTTPTELYVRVQMTVQKIALAVRNAVDADGINIIINNEAAAGQVVFHSHVHIRTKSNNTRRPIPKKTIFFQTRPHKNSDYFQT